MVLQNTLAIDANVSLEHLPQVALSSMSIKTGYCKVFPFSCVRQKFASDSACVMFVEVE